MPIQNDSLLGPFIQKVPSVDEMRRWLFTVRPNVVLTMANSETEAILGDRPPTWNPIVIGRKNFNPQPLKNPRGVARSVVDSQWGDLCDKGIVTHMMLYNEINPHDGRWREYIAWELEALAELSHFGIPYVAGGWSVGQPDELYYRCVGCGYCASQDLPACQRCGDWTEKRIVYWDEPEVHILMSAVAAEGGLLGLHQYSAPGVDDIRDFDPQPTDIWDPTINTSWRILRHRKVRQQLEEFLEPHEIPDFVISECGVEVGAVPWIEGSDLAGWQTTQTAEEYMAGLRWLDFQCRHDSYLRGLIVFIMGTYMGHGEPWVTHDVWNIRQQFGETILDPIPFEEPDEPEPDIPLEDWISAQVAQGAVDELPFVPENYIEALGLRMGWIPTSDEWMMAPPVDIFGEGNVFVKVFVAPALEGGYHKKIVWWERGDWENYKIITHAM